MQKQPSKTSAIEQLLIDWMMKLPSLCFLKQDVMERLSSLSKFLHFFCKSSQRNFLQHSVNGYVET